MDCCGSQINYGFQTFSKVGADAPFNCFAFQIIATNQDSKSSPNAGSSSHYNFALPPSTQLPSLPPWILRNARVRQKACCKLAFLRLSLERIPTRLPVGKENCTKLWLAWTVFCTGSTEKEGMLCNKSQAGPGGIVKQKKEENHSSDIHTSLFFGSSYKICETSQIDKFS